MGGRWQPGQWPWRARLSYHVALRRCSRITSSSLLSGAWWSKYACAEPQLSTLHSSQSVGWSVSQQRRQFARMGTTMIELKRAAHPSPAPRRRRHAAGSTLSAGLWSPRRRTQGAEASRRRRGKFRPTSAEKSPASNVTFHARDSKQHQRIHEQRPIIETSPAAGIAHAPPKTWPATMQ